MRDFDGEWSSSKESMLLMVMVVLFRSPADVNLAALQSAIQSVYSLPKVHRRLRYQAALWELPN